MPLRFPMKMMTRWWQLKYFLEFSPRKLGEMIQIEGCIFFKWVGSTTNQGILIDLNSTSWIFDRLQFEITPVLCTCYTANIFPQNSTGPLERDSCQ